MVALSPSLLSQDPVYFRHTRALPRTTWRENLHRRLFGRYPDSVVERRLRALWLDEHEARIRFGTPRDGG